MEIRYEATIGYERFLQEYLSKNEPVLIGPSATKSWEIFNRWFSPPDGSELSYDYLIAQYGHLRHLVANSTTGECRDELLRDVFEDWRDGEGREDYVRDLHLSLIVTKEGRKVQEELYEVLEICRDDWMNSSSTTDDFRFVYMGGVNTATLLHEDVYSSYSISTNIHGQKHWTLFPPSCAADIEQLVKIAERKDEVIDIRKRESGVLESFRERGMLEVIQGKGETIFVPSGWYHQVENLSNPTVSLNHNWCNSTNLRRMYEAFCIEISKVREGIDDVRELLQTRRRTAERQDGNEGFSERWEVEWEKCVGELMRLNSGWNWMIFWQMIRHALRLLMDEEMISNPMDWPNPTANERPTSAYTLLQVKPILEHFRSREEEEYVYAEGVRGVVDEITELVRRLEKKA